MTLPQPGELVSAYQLRAKKWFGQHFLTDPRILSRICDAGGVAEGDTIVEIGPGCGTLTTTMLERGAHVFAVEIDADAVEFLTEHLVPHGLELLEADATEIDWDSLEVPATRVVANLPYNVATSIVVDLLDSRRFEHLALMFQREVAERICAAPRTKAYGSLSLAVQLFAKPKIAFSLGAGAFTPPPNVTSSLVTFDVHDEPLVSSRRERLNFEEVVRAGFALRRKTLANSLSKGLGRSKDEVKQALRNVDVEPRRRAETLTLEEFRALTSELYPE